MHLKCRVAGLLVLALSACATPGGGSTESSRSSEPARCESDASTAASAIIASLKHRTRRGALPLLPDSEAAELLRDREAIRPQARNSSSHPASVVYPLTAKAPFRVVDKVSSAAIEVALVGASDSAAETADGYVVYRSALGDADLVHRPIVAGTEDYIRFALPPAAPEVQYEIALNAHIAGLRLVSNTLEMLDGTGNPLLRLGAPYVVAADGTSHAAQVSVRGCRVDSDPSAPWGRKPVSAGADRCTLQIAWSAAISHPAVLDPAWTTTGDMVQSRHSTAAALLSDGRVLAVGGLDGSDTIASAELFNPTTRTWAATGSLTTPRHDHTAALFGTKVLVAAGTIPTDGWNGGAEVYDPATGKWTVTGSLIHGRTGHISATLPNGKVLVSGGYCQWNGVGYSTGSELYDPLTGTWSSTNSLSHNRSLVSASQLSNGNVLLTGGYNGNYLADAEVYDYVSGTWSPVGDMHNARSRHAQITLPDGRVLVAGGSNSTSLSSAEVYDPVNKSWTTVQPTAYTRTNGTLAIAGSRPVYFGGSCPSDPLSAEIFDPPSNTWSLTTSLHHSYTYHTATSLAGGRVLAAGGTPSNAPRASELYIPGCATTADCLAGWFCADSYCCDTQCDGACNKCNEAGDEGTCKLAASGSAGDPSCFPFVCTGSGADCPTSCTTNAQCASGYYCAANQCIPKLAQGTSCTASAQCLSGYCYDLFCCDLQCNGACDVCAAALGASADGTCTRITGPGSPSCSPFLCTGATWTCPSNCTGDSNCVSGYYCGGSSPMHCLALKTNGNTCTAAKECLSGICTDGRCCNDACSGACDRCDLASYLGICHAATAGNSGTPSCSPYLCNGSSVTCPTSCSADSDCASSYYCAGNLCVSKLLTGVPCTSNTMCLLGNCVDGYCCDTACTGSCNTCAASLGASSNGHCTNVTGSGSPSCTPYVCSGSSASCPTSCTSSAQCATGFSCLSSTCQAKLPQGSTCSSGDQCTSGFCSDSRCCNQACSGACDACSQSRGAPVDGQCTVVGGAGLPLCSPYLCDGAQASCPTSCTSPNQCATNLCTAGKCVGKAANGVACNQTGECLSGNCVDGVCCDTSCTGQCSACNSPGSVGTCTTSVGAPVGNRPPCTSDGSECGGTCDGLHAQSCQYPGTTQSCGSSSCVEGMITSAPACNGAGACVPGKQENCSPYACTGAVCKTKCQTNADCVTNGFCTGGECKMSLPNGTPCIKDAQCAAGHCVDTVCCESACAEQCATCNAAGSAGLCVVRSGAPAGSRPACEGTGACAGTCNGSSKLACTYPSTATVCATRSCQDAVATEESLCDGKGMCVAGVKKPCGAQGCAGNVCASEPGQDAGKDSATDSTVGKDSAMGGDSAAGDSAQQDGQQAPVPIEVSDGGCGCRTNSASSKVAASWLVGLAVMVLRRLRARRAARNHRPVSA